MTVTIAAFYKFTEIADLEGLRTPLLDLCRREGIKGSILLAHEGINATVSGSADGIETLLAWLRADARFADLTAKLSHAGDHPFQRLKVKPKREIVTFGVPEANPARRVGTYVAPHDWNALIREPDVVVIDTRNSYEVDVGTFEGALDPGTSAFGEFPEFVKTRLDPATTPKVAMFCTGGIRCEKASAYMLAQGFREVYHLQGGILNYLEKVPPEESLWRGECFVFDERVAVGHGVEVGTHVMCRSCGHPMARTATHAQDDAAAVAACPNCGAAPAD